MCSAPTSATDGRVGRRIGRITAARRGIISFGSTVKSTSAVTSMVTVSDARARARKRVEQYQRDWAAGGGEDASLDIVLRPPTEREALFDQDRAMAWVQSWREAAAASAAVELSWGRRQWPSIGAQDLPQRCVVRGADAIAVFAGAAHARDWRGLRDRAERLRAEFGASDALAQSIRAHSRTLVRLGDADFGTLLAVLAWLVEHPASGWRIRQLPIRGIDTKWLEGHRAVVEGLHAAVTGSASLGLLGAPVQVRLRFLDPALRPGGLVDVIAPVEELAALEIEPSVVFVFENLETLFSMPEMPGAVVVHGGGYAVPHLHNIPWIRDDLVVYWGDLDSNGLAILHALRLSCERVTSALMDEATLLRFRDLWVPEPKPATGGYSSLTPNEQHVLDRIRSEGNVRLEQERIDWQYALRALQAASIEASQDLEADESPT